MIYHVVPGLWEMEEEGMLLFIIRLSVLCLGDFLSSETNPSASLTCFHALGLEKAAPFPQMGRMML